jgi:MFS family permease
VISAYVLAFAGLLLLGGRAADLWGRRRLFMIGLATFTGASAWCGLATASWELVAARTVQGAGAAVVTPAALSLLTTTSPRAPGGSGPSASGRRPPPEAAPPASCWAAC